MKKIRFGVMVFVATLVGIVAVAFICAGCADGGVESGGGDAVAFLNRFRTAGTSSYNTIPFIDDRDGKTYNKVKMPDGKTWMAENLNFEAVGSLCIEVNINCEEYFKEYGRLYTWDAAKISCPSGWRLPSNDDWSNLIRSAGSDACTKLKSREGWPDFGMYDANGTDDFKFSALPGGGIIYSDHIDPNPSIMTVGFIGAWWTDTEDNVNGENVMLYKEISSEQKYVVSAFTQKKNSALSVRCILAD